MRSDPEDQLLVFFNILFVQLISYVIKKYSFSLEALIKIYIFVFNTCCQIKRYGPDLDFQLLEREK
ncbi:MAG: hypothetical protein A2V46_03585 [Bacteroidetes bacterium RBG_19FT_COMBO_42_7]|jgi:hypothetical protein|nr:MAG: hypothetical protein A2Y71_15620 [Bacteroidetes bacterium RBG_13_42_15]OFY82766.1 MAG: hypothetical protein A2V46_03585 [Bacteroidetes bacterium RBG_19FT_COMBO_42_7]